MCSSTLILHRITMVFLFWFAFCFLRGRTTLFDPDHGLDQPVSFLCDLSFPFLVFFPIKIDPPIDDCFLSAGVYREGMIVPQHHVGIHSPLDLAHPVIDMRSEERRVGKAYILRT